MGPYPWGPWGPWPRLLHIYIKITQFGTKLTKNSLDIQAHNYGPKLIIQARSRILGPAPYSAKLSLWAVSPYFCSQMNTLYFSNCDGATLILEAGNTKHLSCFGRCQPNYEEFLPKVCWCDTANILDVQNVTFMAVSHQQTFGRNSS